MNKNNKIIIASWTILPWSSGSSFIVEKFAQNFTKDELTILGGKGIFRKIKGKVPSRDVNYYYANTEINILGRGDRFFNWIRWCLLPILVIKMIWVIKKEKCNYIIGVFPDNFYCLASYYASSIVSIPFSSYFHNTYLENRTGFDARFAKKVQKMIFKKSEYIFVMSDGMKNYYSKNYESYIHKFEPLVHTFNKYPKLISNSLPDKKTNEIKLVLVGNFNESNIDATCKLINAFANDKKVKIYVYTQLPKLLMKVKGIPTENIVYKGFIEDHKLIAELQKYDVCVLTHGYKGGYSDIEYQTIFPTRTIPLLLSLKPIFCLAPENSFLYDFFKKNQSALLISETQSNDIEMIFHDFYNNEKLKESIINNASEVVKSFHGPAVKRLFISKLYKE